MAPAGSEAALRAASAAQFPRRPPLAAPSSLREAPPGSGLVPSAALRVVRAVALAPAVVLAAVVVQAEAAPRVHTRLQLSTALVLRAVVWAVWWLLLCTWLPL